MAAMGRGFVVVMLVKLAGGRGFYSFGTWHGARSFVVAVEEEDCGLDPIVFAF
jgi:hypothetical protein